MIGQLPTTDITSLSTSLSLHVGGKCVIIGIEDLAYVSLAVQYIMALECIPSRNPAWMSAGGRYSGPEQESENILMVRRFPKSIRKGFLEVAGKDSAGASENIPKFFRKPRILWKNGYNSPL